MLAVLLFYVHVIDKNTDSDNYDMTMMMSHWSWWCILTVMCLKIFSKLTQAWKFRMLTFLWGKSPVHFRFVFFHMIKPKKKHICLQISIQSGAVMLVFSFTVEIWDVISRSLNRNTDMVQVHHLKKHLRVFSSLFVSFFSWMHFGRKPWDKQLSSFLYRKKRFKTG